MNFENLSLVVGGNACNAACPFCVSKMTQSSTTPACVGVDWDRFDLACRIAQKSTNTAVLTGVGEPTLWPTTIADYLGILSRYELPVIELQTNGVLLPSLTRHLPRWRICGLSLICLSIAEVCAVRSNARMGITDASYNYWDVVDLLHEQGFAVRLNCTMLRSGVHRWCDVDALLDACRRHRVEQLTLRDVTAFDGPGNDAANVAAYVQEQRVPAAPIIREALEDRGAVPVLRKPYGSVVYDFHGQNVCVSNCLTASTDPHQQRQLIYFPDGRLAYDWRYRGARIL